MNIDEIQTMDVSQIIELIRLEQTCVACPEQYDAIIEETNVGYLRLRHGYFTVDCPEPWGETVYEARTIGDGVFEYEERDEHINNAKTKIAEWVKTNYFMFI